jgi:hypothetical protein
MEPKSLFMFRRLGVRPVCALRDFCGFRYQPPYSGCSPSYRRRYLFPKQYRFAFDRTKMRPFAMAGLALKMLVSPGKS